jgi:hypothetical protein
MTYIRIFNNLNNQSFGYILANGKSVVFPRSGLAGISERFGHPQPNKLVGHLPLTLGASPIRAVAALAVEFLRRATGFKYLLEGI